MPPEMGNTLMRQHSCFGAKITESTRWGKIVVAIQTPEVTKMDAVRGALKKLGRKASPQDIRVFIRSEFNVAMEPTLISNYKSHLIRKARRRRLKTRGQAAAVTPAPATGGFSLDDIQAVRQVVQQIGADKVQELVAVLAK
jgi:hypothetical protein